MSVIPENHLGILKLPAFAHVATIGPDGRPQSSPVWFDWDGTYLRFGHNKKGQKYKNILRNPHVAVSITDPANPYHYLEIRGKVVRIEDDPANEFVDSQAKKYLGLDKFPDNPQGIERIVIYIEPEHATGMG